ncbi:hypothetical protein HELRODRAFT_174103 [Helobdella robusta]|uniref:Uncharacterized protein n=1 Tax=Helobdella robusta TaxID=6412 RepID=T1F7L8_HELRO|nr:hypothetical protein HELRODRAFT_174103 [Helobdella robusta]ESO03204.1 hypothetical protein HELRODRAFT_174103 [Helobdella robusta]
MYNFVDHKNDDDDDDEVDGDNISSSNKNSNNNEDKIKSINNSHNNIHNNFAKKNYLSSNDNNIDNNNKSTTTNNNNNNNNNDITINNNNNNLTSMNEFDVLYDDIKKIQQQQQHWDHHGHPRNMQPHHLLPQLRCYQVEAVKWMLRREGWMECNDDDHDGGGDNDEIGGSSSSRSSCGDGSCDDTCGCCGMPDVEDLLTDFYDKFYQPITLKDGTQVFYNPTLGMQTKLDEIPHKYNAIFHNNAIQNDLEQAFGKD